MDFEKTQLELNAAFYDEFSTKAKRHQQLGWGLKESAEIRYKLAASRFVHGSVLDVGCGFGALKEFVGDNVQYWGVEPIDRFREQAQLRCGDAIWPTIHHIPITRKFDNVALIGTLCTQRSLLEAENFISTCWSKCRRVLFISAVHGLCQLSNPPKFLAIHPYDLLAIGRKLADFVRVELGHLRNDVAITIYRDKQDAFC